MFNKNQGAQAEAAIAIEQARARRAFAESVVRSDVAAAYARLAAARTAVGAFEQGVIARSNDNIRVIRAAYDLSQISRAAKNRTAWIVTAVALVALAGVFLLWSRGDNAATPGGETRSRPKPRTNAPVMRSTARAEPKLARQVKSN